MVMKLNEREKEILNQAYNIILDKKVPNAERELVFTFKQDIERGRDFGVTAYHLERALQRLAVTYLKDETSFSEPVHDFYENLNTYLVQGLRNLEIGKGLIILGGIL